MSQEIFPIRLPCNDKGWSSYDFRGHFTTNKPAGLSWYGYDTVILSRTEVEFVAYDMLSSFDGGKGKEIFRFNAFVLEEHTRAHIERKIRNIAEARRAAELEAAEALIIARYCNEIRAAQIRAALRPTPSSPEPREKL